MYFRRYFSRLFKGDAGARPSSSEWNESSFLRKQPPPGQGGVVSTNRTAVQLDYFFRPRAGIVYAGHSNGHDSVEPRNWVFHICNSLSHFLRLYSPRAHYRRLDVIRCYAGVGKKMGEIILPKSETGCISTWPEVLGQK